MSQITLDGSVPDSRTQQRRQALIILILGLAIAAIAIVYAWQSGQKEAPPPAALVHEEGVFPVTSLFGIDNTGAQPDAGHPAPNFAFRLPDGATATLADYRGQPVLINFWATWCGPCRLEMPELVNTYETYKDDGLVILEVNIAESNETVAAFVEEFGMTMPVIIDARQEVMSLYRTQSLPSTFFIDKNGVIQLRWVGFLNREVLEKNLATILG